MPGLIAQLTERLQPAFDEFERGADPGVRPSDRADAQANGALALAKRLGRPPREVAEQIVATAAAAGLAGVCEVVEVAGPGFVNLTVSKQFLADQLRPLLADDRAGLSRASAPQTVVVDYSAPNAAKEMHVGHVRSTIIGDALCRMLEVAGHHVIRQNHLGDWGTPFGMLIEHLRDVGEEKGAAQLSVGDLQEFYREARAKFDSDETFAERSRRRVVLLQGGDEETLRLWRLIVDESLRHFEHVYDKLGVLLTPDDVAGESFYNPLLQDVVADLAAQGLLVDSDGAKCVFPPGFTNRDGDPLPLIVQKSDGGFGYAATDLAAIRHRVGTLHADRILYVIGAPQSEHMAMCYAVARMAGWLPPDVEAIHVSFGNMLGPDRKMFRTRAGDVVRLDDLVDEAIERAATVVAEKNPTLTGEEHRQVARMVGVGAIKYADLSTDRVRDEIFDWDRMLSFDGNTAAYLQMAHARIRSIERRAAEDGISRGPVPDDLSKDSFEEPAERALAVSLLGFDDAFGQSLQGLVPHRLCTYLFELAGRFTAFYENCPVLRAPDERTRRSRLALSHVTAAVLAQGLAVLGIGAPQRM